MKKIILMMATASLLIGANACKSKKKTATEKTVEAQTADNSQNSLNWDGTYVGPISCAGYPAAQATITLYPDGLWDMFRIYIGGDKDLVKVYTGTFSWDSTGNNIKLAGLPENEGSRDYKVGETGLIELDNEGKPLIGELNEKYVLAKKISEENSSDSEHNSQNSLNWDGTYTGKVIPCPDCPTVETTITLYQNNTFDIAYKNGNESIQLNGKPFRWNTAGGEIVLFDMPENIYSNRYKVGENRLIQLDLKHPSEFADRAYLQKK
ncbi:MAG: copper resistance protein NlpE [Prevotellaceae bacterium]|jgi:uncharacterized lipoprotein NlpE involved in copper resistance|nr:copper resistance protein NlpE [Prevotellaceae bacterium]